MAGDEGGVCGWGGVGWLGTLSQNGWRSKLANKVQLWGCGDYEVT